MKRGLMVLSCSSVALLASCLGGGDGDSGGNRTLPPTHPLNDTGITLCGDYAFGGSTIHNNNVTCDGAGATQTTGGTDGDGDPVPAGQDAVYGRDVTENRAGDGFRGFSFTKLDAMGNAMAIQNGTWSDAGTELNGTKWSCVRDEVTGLVWEMKTNDTSLHGKNWTYTWYNSNPAENGGDSGLTDAVGVGIGSDNCFTSSLCDTEKFVAQVNATGLCGSGSWRLPSPEELKTLRHLGVSSPAIVAAWLPNTASVSYWTAGSRVSDSAASAWVIDFDSGAVTHSAKSSFFAVRLVRDAN